MSKVCKKLFVWTFKIKIIEKSQLKHKNKYDYSNGMYINCKTKVKIICIIHGEFEQVALNHMKGHDCVLCAGDQLRSSSNEFIEKAKKSSPKLVQLWWSVLSSNQHMKL